MSKEEFLREQLAMLREMNDQLIPDAEIPKQVEIDGRCWLVIDRMQNFHYRALLLPVGGGTPRWFSNAELSAAIKTVQENT